MVPECGMSETLYRRSDCECEEKSIENERKEGNQLRDVYVTEILKGKLFTELLCNSNLYSLLELSHERMIRI